jgi:hypothetical protein
MTAPKIPRPIIWSNPAFNFLICIVTATMAAAFFALVALAFFGKDPPGQLQTRLGEACFYILMVALPALVGLLCGRAGAPDPPRPQDG